jgi:futalosine hydrolase
MKFIALLSSMPFESENILNLLKDVRRRKIAGKTVYKGKLSGADLIMLNTGIGKVNAAHSATCIIENIKVKKIINMGVGGAYPGSGLRAGDIAVAAKEFYGDEGVADSNGWSSLRKIGIPLVCRGSKNFFNEFPVSTPPISTLLRGKQGEFKELTKDLQIKSGNFVTVSSATGNNKRAVELEKRFGALCENMEGAAIAQVCTIYGIPVSEIRGISNIAGVRDKRKWNLRLASENCQKAVLEMIMLQK